MKDYKVTPETGRPFIVKEATWCCKSHLVGYVDGLKWWVYIAEKTKVVEV